jgi:hypothetical protein
MIVVKFVTDISLEAIFNNVDQDLDRNRAWKQFDRGEQKSFQKIKTLDNGSCSLRSRNSVLINVPKSSFVVVL